MADRVITIAEPTEASISEISLIYEAGVLASLSVHTTLVVDGEPVHKQVRIQASDLSADVLKILEAVIPAALTQAKPKLGFAVDALAEPTP